MEFFVFFPGLHKKYKEPLPTGSIVLSMIIKLCMIGERMTKNGMMAGLLAVPALLMAWGSLRYTLTPVGYWAAWGLWALAAIAVVGVHGWIGQALQRPALWIVGALAALILGMVLSAGVNHDGVTLYQAMKIGVIGLLFWVMWGVAARSGTEDLIRALYSVLALVVLIFFLSKIFSTTSYRLGGDREGDIFARAGVIWKAGLFFLPLFLADWLCQPRRWVVASAAIGASLFLVVADGSRTGLLLIPAVCLGMVLVTWWRGDAALLRRRPWMPLLAAGVLFVLLLLNTGLNLWRLGASHRPAGMTDIAQVESWVGRAVAPVVDNRLGEGDAPRMRLLRNGLEKSRACFPLGCGFGSTAMDAGYGMPMNVHNAYLGALADFGLLGLLGMLGFVAAAALPLLWVARDRQDDPVRAYVAAAAAGSALAYCAALSLHTFSTEMSEWGYLLLMLAFAWRPARVS